MNSKLPLAIQLIIKYRLKYIFFTVFSLIAVSYLAILSIDISLNWLKQVQKEFNLIFLHTVILKGFIQILISYISLCAILAILLLPVRYSLQHNFIMLRALICEVPFTMAAINKCCFRSLQIGLYYLFPAIAVFFAYLYWARGLEKESLRQLYLIITLFVAGISTIKSIPAMVAPIIAGCFGTNSAASIQYSINLTSAFRNEITFFFLSYLTVYVLAIAGLSWIEVSQCISHLEIGKASLAICKWELVVTGVFFWLFISGLCGSLIKFDALLHPPQEGYPQEP